jgi:hypothetical protein
MDLNNSIVRITALSIKLLKKERVLNYEAFKKKLITIFGEDIEYHFTNVLTVLFSLGLIVYHEKTDMIEFIK